MGLLAENGKISPEYFQLIISHFLQTRPRPAMAQPSDPGSGPGPLRSEREEAEAEPVGLQARRSSLSAGTAGVCCGSGRKNLNDFKQLKLLFVYTCDTDEAWYWPAGKLIHNLLQWSSRLVKNSICCLYL